MRKVKSGQFVIHCGGERHEGLAVDEALALIENAESESLELYRIHRVAEDGRLELVGISVEALKKRDCMVFMRQQRDAAEADYQALSGYADDTPPPCKIEMQLAHAPTLQPQHLVLLIFPTACQTAVGSWLAAADFQPGDTADGSPAVLEAIESAIKQIMLTKYLQPLN